MAKLNALKSPRVAHALHRAEHGAHFLYFGAAFMDFHHIYAILAGIIACVMAVAWLIGQAAE